MCLRSNDLLHHYGLLVEPFLLPHSGPVSGSADGSYAIPFSMICKGSAKYLEILLPTAEMLLEFPSYRAAKRRNVGTCAHGHGGQGHKGSWKRPAGSRKSHRDSLGGERAPANGVAHDGARLMMDRSTGIGLRHATFAMTRHTPLTDARGRATIANAARTSRTISAAQSVHVPYVP